VFLGEHELARGMTAHILETMDAAQPSRST
jgi:hypothetical protein